MESNVHTRHCCKEHGCKYGDEDCPVANGIQRAEYPCEYCEELDFFYGFEEEEE